MDAEEIDRALRDVAARLTAKGVTTDIRLVGGAALILRHQARANTGDVDADIRGQHIDNVTREVALARGLDDDWLNSKATMFFPNVRDPEWELLWTTGSVSVYAASDRTLLAMKLLAGRTNKDRGDIEFLLQKLWITNYEEAAAVFDEFYPQEIMKGKALLRAILSTSIETTAPTSAKSGAEDSTSGGNEPS
jgi:hypothetical protein